MINVTKPFLPPVEDYQKMIVGIWNRRWLTNNGPLVNELELSIKEYLDLNHMLYLNNGTIALQIALKALDIREEVITTPFSYVATTSSIVWENCTPVFVDIDPVNFNINPTKIEAAITERTQAILATHVYGNPCDIEAIEKIAKKHNLRVIYDAAHAFGTKYKGKSIFNFGDICTTSFHATKLFHTIEGGAVFSQNPELIRIMAFMRNFGHHGTEEFDGIGINGKSSEFHAAMGLLNLNYIESILASRKRQWLRYQEKLRGLFVKFIKIQNHTEFNYAYFPILFEKEELLLESVELLNQNLIFPRRYFYPSLSTLPYVTTRQDLSQADSISRRVLCLPMYHDLSDEEIDFICRILLRVQNN
jgi:dTDP-4-amino-4,6-dideoxygalactose transaminase